MRIIVILRLCVYIALAVLERELLRADRVELAACWGAFEWALSVTVVGHGLLLVFAVDAGAYALVFRTRGLLSKAMAQGIAVTMSDFIA